MSEVFYDIDAITKAYMINENFSEAFAKFTGTGIDSIRNCGITGGDQKKLIDKACDTIEEKAKLLINGIKENMEDIETCAKNAEGFDMQDIINRATKIAEEAKKTGKVGVNKVF